MKTPRGWTVRVEGRPSKPVDPYAWMDLIEHHSGVLSSPREFEVGGDNFTGYTVSLAVSRAGRAVDIAIGLVRPADPRFEVSSLEVMTFEEQDRRG